MGRITPDMLKEAYAKTGLKPIRNRKGSMSEQITPDNLIRKLQWHKREETPTVCLIAKLEIEKHRDEIFTLREAIRAVLAMPVCRSHYVDEPEGTTCWTKHLRAKAGEGRLCPEWRARLASRSELCDCCQITARLSDAVSDQVPK